MSVRARVAALVISAVSFAGCAAPGTTYITSKTAPDEHTITVAGTARLEIVPDEACVELTLVARDAAMPVAHARLMEARGVLLAELKPMNDLAVEAGAVTYAPDYEPFASGSRLAGYAATARVNVRTRDFDRIPDVVGRAAPRGLEGVDIVYYSTDIVKRRAELRDQALDAAREKAQAMAAVLDVSLDGVVTITEGGFRSSDNVHISSYSRENVDVAPDVPPVPGAIPLSMTVGVVYRLKERVSG